MDSVRAWHETFTTNISDPQNKNQVNGCLYGLFVGTVGIAICAVSYRYGLHDRDIVIYGLRNCAAITGVTMAIFGNAVLVYGIYKLTRPIQPQHKPQRMSTEGPETPDNISPAVREVFELLFQGSSYKLDQLPRYAEVITAIPHTHLMKNAVERGMTKDGRDCVLIKVKTTLTFDQVTNRYGYTGYRRDQLLNPSTHEKIIVLMPDEEHKNSWAERDGWHKTPIPQFFSCGTRSIFTDDDGKLLETQAQHVVKFQELFTKGKSVDRNEVTWELAI